MTHGPIARDGYHSALKAAFRETGVRLIHLHGIAGSGKTTLAHQCLPETGGPVVTLQARLKSELEISSLLSNMEKVLLSASQRQILAKRTDQALIAAGYAAASRSHTLVVEGQGRVVAYGDVIVGDKVEKTDAQFHRETVDRARLRLDVLADLLDSPEQPVCTVLIDSLEALSVKDNPFCRWLSATFLESGSPEPVPIRILTTSRSKRTLECRPEACRQLKVGPMSEEESSALLRRHGLTKPNDVEWAITVTRGHPLALVLAAHLGSFADVDGIELPSRSPDVYEELITEVLLRRVIEDEKDELLRRALTTVPVLRFFFPDQVGALLNCSQSETERVVSHLREFGFIETTQGVMKYHDLLRELTLKHLIENGGTRALRALHLEAAAAFSPSPHDSGPIHLVELVEPFYHFLNGNLKEAVNFSERHLKPALDRKLRGLSAALVSQIDADCLPPSTSKGWLLLRKGGYHREFRDYPQAVAIFNEALQLAGPDKRLRASVLNNLGWVYLYSGEKGSAERAIALFQESNQYCVECQFDDILAMNYNNLGIGHSRLPKSAGESELRYYSECLAITESEDTRNALVSGMAFQNAALVLQKERNFGGAVDLLIKAVERYREAESGQREAWGIYLIANVLLEAGQPAEARKLLDTSLRGLLGTPDGDPHFVTENFLALARVLAELNEPDHMRQCLFSAATISLFEGVEFHVYTVGRVVQLSRWSFALRGLDFAQETLGYLKDEWSASEHGTQIPQFCQLLTEEADALAGCSYWTNGKRHVLHLAGPGVCKPKGWDRVSLLGPERGNRRLCKRCSGNYV